MGAQTRIQDFAAPASRPLENVAKGGVDVSFSIWRETETDSFSVFSLR